MEEKVKKTEPVFSKERLTQSAKYADNQDILDALLSEEKNYTYKQVDELIHQFKKGSVK